MDSLKNKSVILTGAGSGIGRITAKMLGAMGANVFIVGRRENLLIDTFKEIEEAGGKGAYISADLEDGDAAANVAEVAIKEFGNIQYLINNAGHSSKVRALRYVEKEDWQSVFNVNVPWDGLPTRLAANSEASLSTSVSFSNKPESVPTV